MGKYLSMSGEVMNWHLSSLHRVPQPYKEGPLLPIEGWLYTLIALNESMSTTETRVKGKPEQHNSQSMRMC